MENHQAPILVRNVVTSPLGRISLAGFVHNSPGLPAHPLRELGSYALVYMLAGEIRYRDATGRNLNVYAGDLMLLFPDLAHTYGPDERRHWTALYIVFNGPVFDLWRSLRLLDPAQPLHHLQPIDFWARQFESVLEAPHHSDLAPPLLEVCRLQLVLGQALLNGPSGRLSDEEIAWVTRACALLASDLGRTLQLHEVAHELGMSYDQFRKRFARSVGVPPGRYRTVCTFDRACELIQQGGLTDRQIAHSLGFCNEFHFSRRFKQVVGRTPSQFRYDYPQVQISRSSQEIVPSRSRTAAPNQ